MTDAQEPGTESHQLWVIDTSSLLAIREHFSSAHERKILAGMAGYATRKKLFYPPEVCSELERGAESLSNPDAPLIWARDHKHCSERPAELTTLRRILERVPDLIDPDNPYEQADPYVLAVALDLHIGGFDVCVVTEDRRDRPTRVSLATAAGMFRLATVPLHAFVRGEKLYP
jgi:uncharacterized protein DUF4411